MKKVISKLKVTLLIGMIAVPVILMAQPTGTGGPEDLVLDAPFDGGVSLLVAAGVAYGLKKANDKRKAEKV